MISRLSYSNTAINPFELPVFCVCCVVSLFSVCSFVCFWFYLFFKDHYVNLSFYIYLFMIEFRFPVETNFKQWIKGQIIHTLCHYLRMWVQNKWKEKNRIYSRKAHHRGKIIVMSIVIFEYLDLSLFISIMHSILLLRYLKNDFPR